MILTFLSRSWSSVVLKAVCEEQCSFRINMLFKRFPVLRCLIFAILMIETILLSVWLILTVRILMKSPTAPSPKETAIMWSFFISCVATTVLGWIPVLTLELRLLYIYSTIVTMTIFPCVFLVILAGISLWTVPPLILVVTTAGLTIRLTWNVQRQASEARREPSVSYVPTSPSAPVQIVRNKVETVVWEILMDQISTAWCNRLLEEKMFVYIPSSVRLIRKIQWSMVSPKKSMYQSSS